MARTLDVSAHRRTALKDGWQVVALEAGAAAHPSAVRSSKWVEATAPGTAASALRSAGLWSFAEARNFDAEDWWFRRPFKAARTAAGRAQVVTLDGLATVADVWLNGEKLLHSDNMFHAHQLDVSEQLREDNELVVCFRSLEALLAAKRPRPRWRTRLVPNQSLRWFRTTLLGRIPSWTPPVAPVGPWRGVAIEERTLLSVEEADLRTRVEGGDGVATLSLRVRSLDGRAPTGGRIQVGEGRAKLTCRAAGEDVYQLEGELRLPGVPLWWPHTHGAQPLFAARVEVDAAVPVTVDLGRVGFRTIEVDAADGGFSFRVNGCPVFCRGACWTTTDIVTLTGSPETYAAALDAARAAGMNMLRVSGTMHYEDDLFHAGCDERGILVWQDFMFANMDYPADDAAFSASVEREAAEHLGRVQTSPSLALLCGNTEVDQQVTMLGLPGDLCKSALFDTVLPAVAARWRPDVPYQASNPSGGALPFHVRSGVSHYYGVGAYRRPLEDARRAGVRFTSECLGLSHVPEESTVELTVPDGRSPVHDPMWKARVPRDRGASWDFEDIRDHYLRVVFGGADPDLRHLDMPRYLALSRVVTGELILNVLGEWRRRASSCKGALLWFYRDFWPGAGWGIVDSTGTPKAAYYYAKRAMQPVALFLSDEGLDGLELHALNETSVPIDAQLGLTLYRHQEIPIASATVPVTLPARGGLERQADAMLERFLDTTYAYRFGVPGHDLAVASLTDRATNQLLARSFHFPTTTPSSRGGDLGVEAVADPLPEGLYRLTVRATRFAQSVSIDAPHHLPDDNYFHVEPGTSHTVTLRPRGAARPLAGAVSALNSTVPVRIVVAGVEGKSR